MHRSILAVDIEGSTRRTNPVKEELRDEVYRLVIEALCVTGIGSQHYDPFTDRGDGLLVLLHPADELPKPVLLSHLIPALAGCSPRTTAASLRPTSRASCGCERSSTRGRCTATGMGPSARTWTWPSASWMRHVSRRSSRARRYRWPLVASDYIYQSIIRHGYDGIDDTEFLPLVTVKVGDQRRRGWVHFPFAGGIPVGVPTLPQAS